MRRNLKKMLAVTLSMAMIASSVTIYNTTAKADDTNQGIAVTAEEDDAPKAENVNVTASVVNNMINASWSQPDVEFVTLAYFINYAGNIQLDSDHWAKASNGWCWTQANPTENRTALDTVSKSNDGSIDVANGGTYVLTVQYLDAEGNVVASGTSNAVTTEKVVNTDLNLKVERYEPGIAYLKWTLIGGAAKYEVYNADTNELMKTSDSSTTDWTNVTIKQGVTYNLVVKAINAAGEEITITNNTTTAYQENTELNLKASYVGNTATLTWSEITGASRYEIYDNGEKIVELESTVLNYKIENLVENATHNITIKAFGEDGKEIEITKNTVTVEYSKESKAPEEHRNADFSNATWEKLATKKGTVDNTYSINADHTLSKAVWYGIYAPHSAADYHNDRTNCIIPDNAESFTFQQTNVKNIWINGAEYDNPSTAFNCQGDCSEISVEALEEGINVITLVLNDDTKKTFGIKVAAPLGIDATQEAEQVEIDPATVAEWTQMVGTTANGSKVYKDSTAQTSEDDGMNGCYAAGEGPQWEISDIMKLKDVFAVVFRKNIKSVILDGTEYINAADVRSTKVYIGAANCIYIDAKLLDASAGEVQYHTITVKGDIETTFILKVEGPENPDQPSKPGKPKGLADASDDNLPYYFAWASESGVTYNVYIDNKNIAQVAGSPYDATEYVRKNNLKAGEHVFAIAAVKDEIESDKATVDFTVKTNQVTVETETEEIVNGATYTLPTTEGVTGYYLDEKLYRPGSAYTVTKDVEFKAVTIEASMDAGAGIRLDENNSGLRFKTTVTSTGVGLASIGDSLSEGTLITTNKIYTEKHEPTIGDSSIYKVGTDLIKIENNGWYNNQEGIYYGSVVNINDYETNFIARAYVTVKFEDGGTTTIYSEMSDVRSIKEVANAILTTDNGKRYFGTLAVDKQALIKKFAGTDAGTDAPTEENTDN